MHGIELHDGRRWTSIGAEYEITRKPRGLDLRSVPQVPFVPMNLLPEGGRFEPEFIWKATTALSSGTYFESGDILLAKITPSFENGKQALVQNLEAPFGYATTEVIPLRPTSTDQDPRFLFYYLLHPQVRSYVAERMEGSTGRQRIPDGVLLELQVPALGKEEQTQVANVLELVQRCLQLELEEEELASQLKRAAMHELFTRGLRGEEASSTAFGMTPHSWQLVRLGSLVRSMQYGLSRRGQSTGSYPILRMNCQENGKVVLRDLQFVDLDSETAASFLLRTGDILFNRTNSYELVGRTAIVDSDHEAVFASYLVRVAVDPARLDPFFLNYFLNWDVAQAELKKLASRAVGQSNISAGKLRGFEVPVPQTLEEQRDVVAILEAIDRKIDLHKRERAVLQDLFRTLLHQLMTGEIRVADLDLSVLESAATREARA